jgi:hypothetical protein
MKALPPLFDYNALYAWVVPTNGAFYDPIFLAFNKLQDIFAHFTPIGFPFLVRFDSNDTS